MILYTPFQREDSLNVKLYIKNSSVHAILTPFHLSIPVYLMPVNYVNDRLGAAPVCMGMELRGLAVL